MSTDHDAVAAVALDVLPEPKKPRTKDEKAAMVDAIKAAHVAHKAAVERTLAAGREASAAHRAEMNALGALQSIKEAFRLEMEADDG